MSQVNTLINTPLFTSPPPSPPPPPPPSPSSSMEHWSIADLVPSRSWYSFIHLRSFEALCLFWMGLWTGALLKPTVRLLELWETLCSYINKIISLPRTYVVLSVWSLRCAPKIPNICRFIRISPCFSGGFAIRLVSSFVTPNGTTAEPDYHDFAGRPWCLRSKRFRTSLFR